MAAIQARNGRVRGVSTKAGVLGTLGIVAVLTLTSTEIRSQQINVAGIVDSPRSFVGTVTPETRLGFGGWVNFPASQGQIQMDVLRVGNDVGTIAQRTKGGLNSDLTPANCNVNNEDQKLWARNVVRITIDGSLSVVNGQNHFRWYTGTFTPFQPDAVSAVPENRIPEGGIARVRFRAIVSGKETLLHGLDSDGVPTTGCEVLIGDASPGPTNPPKGITLGLFPFSFDMPTPDYLNKGAQGGAAATGDYYDRVHIEPDGTGIPIIGVLTDHSGPRASGGYYVDRSFDGGIRTLDAFKEQYGFTGPKAGQTERVENVSYFNQGDLGIGRQMSCAKNINTDETACFVENFGKIDGTPLFDSFDSSVESMRTNHPFATVAMVERGKMPFGSKNKVFFVVYDKSGGLNQSGAQLDNKGFNESIPGNCLACHGGKLEQDGKGKVTGVSGASFLPFVVNSYRYYDDKLKIAQNNNSQGDLQASFKRLNEIVYSTDLYYNDAARTLINGWYGNSNPTGTGLMFIAPKLLLPGISFFPSSTFDDKFVPAGWNSNKENQQLYRQVVAPYCQTCHITSKTFSFSTADEFKNLRAAVYQDVCGNHSMPNAEMTSKLLWKSNARQQLLDRLNILNGCGWESPNLNSTIVVESLPGKIEEPATGCPTGFLAKSTFDIRIENPFFSKTRPSEVNNIVNGLSIEVSSLTNGNRILFPDGTTGAAGSVFAPVIRTFLPGMVENVPISICLKQKGPSNFAVNVLGTEQ